MKEEKDISKQEYLENKALIEKTLQSLKTQKRLKEVETKLVAQKIINKALVKADKFRKTI